MAESVSKNGHIPALDGLRGLAVIAVIVCHVNHGLGGPFVPGRINGPMGTVFGWGWIGVDLFFVLSGFLITGILYDAKGLAGYFRNFYARRTLRIMPLYYGFLFFAIVVLPGLPWDFCRKGSISQPNALSLGLYYYNFRVAATEKAVSFFHPFWSLAIEEHFYLLWPFAVWALQRGALMRLCLGAAAASFFCRVLVVLSGAWIPSVFFYTPCRLDGLLAGSFVALAFRDQTDWTRLKCWAGRLTFSSGCLLLGIAIGQRHFIPDVDFRRGIHPAAVDGSVVVTIGVAALAVFFAGLLILVVEAREGSLLRRVLQSSGLRAVGKYSYAIYVFHTLILLVLLALISPLSFVPAYVAKPLGVMVVLAVSFVAAWLSYHLYEKHFLRLKRFFEYREPAHTATPLPSQWPSYHAYVQPVQAEG